jgi:hypothetical protein
METLAEMGNNLGKMGNLIFGVSHSEILASAPFGLYGVCGVKWWYQAQSGARLAKDTAHPSSVQSRPSGRTLSNRIERG